MSAKKNNPKKAKEKASGRRQAAPQTALGRLLASPGRTAAVLFVIAFALYANTLGHQFVWDDRDLIVENPGVRVLNADALRTIFVENFWQNFSVARGYYRPLVTLSYHLQWAAFDGSPSGFHFANVAWNAIVCVLLFAFVYRLFGNVVFAATTALLFAVFPLHTENVAWVSGRTDVLASLWMLVSLLLYVLWKRRRRASLLAGSLLTFALALLAKESAVAGLFVVALLEFGPFEKLLGTEGRPAKRSAVTPALYAGVVALYLLMRNHVLGTGLSTYKGYAEGALAVIGLPLSILAGYAWKLLFPFRLNAEYDAPVPESFANVHVAAGAIVLAGIVFAAWRWRRSPAVLLGIAVFVFGIAPVSNIVPLGEISAERFMYIPSMGFALIVGWIVTGALAARYPDLRQLAGDARVPQSAARVVVAVFGVLVLAYAAQTVLRNPVWKNEQVLFPATAKAAPQSARAHFNVGADLQRRGQVQASIDWYKKALEIKPDYPDAMSNLAGAYAGLGRFDDALPLVERALELAPNQPKLMSNLGSLYFEKGRYDEAAQQFERVLAINPNDRAANFNLGLIRVQQRRPAQAKRHFTAVAGAGPQFALAHYHLAIIEMNAGNPALARQHAQQFLREYPRNDHFRQQAQRIASGG